MRRRHSADETRALTVLAERAMQLEAGDPSFKHGLADAEAGLVSGQRFSGGVLRARVRGTRRYRVSIDLRDEASFSCDCPIGAEGEVCKHCVAAVLTWIGRPR